MAGHRRRRARKSSRRSSRSSRRGHRSSRRSSRRSYSRKGTRGRRGGKWTEARARKKARFYQRRHKAGRRNPYKGRGKHMTGVHQYTKRHAIITGMAGTGDSPKWGRYVHKRFRTRRALEKAQAYFNRYRR